MKTDRAGGGGLGWGGSQTWGGGENRWPGWTFVTGWSHPWVLKSRFASQRGSPPSLLGICVNLPVFSAVCLASDLCTLGSKVDFNCYSSTFHFLTYSSWKPLLKTHLLWTTLLTYARLFSLAVITFKISGHGWEDERAVLG